MKMSPMPIQQKLAVLWQYIMAHSRNMILSLILLYALAGMLNTSSLWSAMAGLLLGIVYLVLLWSAKWLLHSGKRTIAVIGIWMLTAFYWIAFDAGELVFALLCYLIAYIVLRLPILVSVLLTLTIITADAAILHMQHVYSSDIIAYSVMHAGIYILFWGTRIKREAAETSKRHYEQLREVHAELEDAHLELQETHRELESATNRLLHFAVLEERSRISHDLHDSIGHGLTSVIVQLQALPYMMKMDAVEAETALRTVLEVARGCLQEVRFVVHQMSIDKTGLGLIALRSLVKQVQEQVEFHISFSVNGRTGKWESTISELLYRILQEALTNVIRHAQASRVDITVSDHTGKLTMIVTDNGGWTGADQNYSGFGLSGIKARCERAGGSLKILTAEPHGMKLVIQVPMALGKTEMKGEEE
ncbi:sensor histidine kinase [Paenibacillus terrae]|nr:sensor histidine kinase [Paenibacillus terrae]